MPPPLQAQRLLLSHRRLTPSNRRRFTAVSSLPSAPAKTLATGAAPSSILSIRESLLSGERTAADITADYLSRLRRTEPSVRSFIHLADAAAEREAEELDRRIATGGHDAVGPLAGVLVGVKDNLCTANMPSTGGSQILDGYRPAYDATAVRRLREAGAIVVGKTNLDEFGMGSTTEGSGFQVTTNPWDGSRVPGGSSGGSASAVSARQCVVSLGSDTGGSVRQPASFCGVVGLKPTYGRVSRFGLMAYASSLDVVGCFGSSVVDTATVLSVIAGHDKMDSTSSSHDVPDYKSELIPLDLLESKPLNAYYILASSEASSNLSRYDGIRYGRQVSADDLNGLYGGSRANGLGHEVKMRILMGTYALSAGYYDAYYKRAQQVRTLVKKSFNEALERYDILVSPAAPSAAYKIGEKINDPLAMYAGDIMTVNVNLAGLPALVVPCGFVEGGSAGLPVGLQMIGSPFSEGNLLRVGHIFEQTLQNFSFVPPLLAEG
ncbi:hypothetical protein GUJ93_ZPchr0458g22872 [Zizania palustris]|uniref:Glutamyl-tRNA(Gln) amidotransferase subunit A, chloroplastic/mitochondrial n=1 Tax=Zizania palustris TaxID=103762 RepID=A0A8J5VE08_ZIZPA|nr:hypothetical protein GUJ93_ZPchr0458g22872 [Zizania palustris]